MLFTVLSALSVFTGFSSFATADFAGYRDPFERSGEKIRLQLQKKRAAPLELAVLVDEICVAKRGRVQGFLGDLKLPPLPLVGTRSPIQTYKIIAAPGATLHLDWAEADPCIHGISENRTAYAEQIPNDPLMNRQPYLETIQYLPSYGFFAASGGSDSAKNPVIAVIDTGIELTHADLAENLWKNPLEFTGKAGTDDDGNGYVDDIHGYNFPSESGDPSHETANDHGTHVAGLAAAATGNGLGVVGIAGQKAKIMALNVFGKNWGTESVYIDRAIRYAADNGAHVINISINGGGESDTTAAAIVYALRKGTLVVVSAGNKNEDIGTHFTFPASYADRYPGLLAVGAIDQQTRLRCDFSNFNAQLVKVAAPGCDANAPQKGIYSTRKNNLYGYKAGTSMAAPIAAGALALTYASLQAVRADPVSPLEVETLFLRGAEPVTDLATAFGSGRVVNLLRLTDVLQK